MPKTQHDRGPFLYMTSPQSCLSWFLCFCFWTFWTFKRHFQINRKPIVSHVFLGQWGHYLATNPWLGPPSPYEVIPFMEIHILLEPTNSEREVGSITQIKSWAYFFLSEGFLSVCENNVVIFCVNISQQTI